MSDGGIAGFYNTVAAASAGAVKLSATQGQTTGTIGDYLESIVISAGATPGIFSLLDSNTTTILTFTPVANTVTYFPLRIYAKVTNATVANQGWFVNTGAAATTNTVIAVGKFS